MSFAADFPAQIVVDGTRLETRWLGPGPGEAPTLVLLHEGLGCISTWGRFPERLVAATGCGVFLYSRAGYGGSDPIALPRPITYMHDEALHVLPKVLEAIGPQQAILLGHSDGGSIAAIHAGGVRDPRVRAAILIAPHFFTEDFGIAAIGRMRQAFDTGDVRAKLARHHGANVDCAFEGWARAWQDPQFRSWDIQEYVEHIRMPLLLIQGLDDPYGSLRQVEVVPELTWAACETLIVDHCGHAPHAEASEATLAAIRSFLAHLRDIGAVGP